MTSVWSYLGSFDDRRFMLPGLGVMPRRDPFFTLTGRVDRLPFTLRIANPMHTRTFPEWRTGPVPATNHVDGFDFALADARLTRTDYGEHLSVGFKAFEKGRELEDWFKYSWQLSDATGNRGYRLSTNEPAWRIELKVERQLAARWATNDYREFELAGIPKDGELREFPVVATLGGAKVARAWFAGAGEFVMENGVFTISQPLAPGRSDGWSSSSRGPSDWEIMLKRRRPWILVQRDDRSVDHLVRAFLRDARGREIRVDHRGSSGVGYFSAEVFEIRTDDEPPEGPLTLRIAGERYLRTAFTIGPARLERIDLRRSKK
jgi:hypothetical protein